MIAEWLVGLLDAERSSSAEWTAEDFKAGRVQAAPVTDEDLLGIRDRRRQLFEQWAAIEPGSALKLIWDPTAVTSAR
jgi:hypothetical protein